MGLNSAWTPILTPYPFFICRNTPLVRISLKSGENSDLTPFDPISTRYNGQKGVKYCMDRKSDPVPFLHMQKYTFGANFIEIG